MNKKDIISIERICSAYKVPNEFIDELIEFELIDAFDIDRQRFVSESVLPDIEKMINMRYELNINMEGISVIHNLLQRIEEMDEEIRMLRNRLRRYE